MSREWRKRYGLLPTAGMMQIYLAKFRGVVGQKKMFCAATGKRNVFRVSLGLW